LAFFFDSCVAWREGENSDTVVLVEFKKPMRDNYTVGRDRVQQVFHYVKLLRIEKAVRDIRGVQYEGSIRALYKQLIDRENAHDIAAVRRMVWNSPSCGRNEVSVNAPSVSPAHSRATR
jgi:methylaspartate ammonia-lyase